MKAHCKLKNTGFTLIEAIITIVVIAVVGAMMVSVMGTSMTRSSEPVFLMQTSFSLQQVMENFVAAYEKYYAGDLDGLKAEIGAEGTSSSSDSKYGQYKVIDNHYIKFDSANNETVAGETETHNLLKVTLKNSNNEILTYIFAG